jgi:hypothetical protein
MVGAENFEISTYRLKAGYSSSELRTPTFWSSVRVSNPSALLERQLTTPAVPRNKKSRTNKELTVI